MQMHSDTMVLRGSPVTHAKIFGWYDNEYGIYTNLFGDFTVHVHRTMD